MPHIPGVANATWDGWAGYVQPPRRRWIVDDYGDARLYRRCSHCHRWLEQTLDHFAPRTRFANGYVKHWDSRCRPCRRVWANAYYHSVPAERRRQENAERWERVKDDPEMLAHKRARGAEVMRARRHRDPERARASAKRYYDRLRNDPVLWQENLDKKRMNYRLKAEREGRTLRKPRPQDVAHNPRSGRLSGLPLADYVERERLARDMSVGEICEWMGIAVRWGPAEWRRTGTCTTTMADRALTTLDAHWWEVWPMPVAPAERGPAVEVSAYLNAAFAHADAAAYFEEVK